MARVLVAEDENAVREFVTRALSHAGHDVVAVADGLQALGALSGGSYDLLVTDIVMPGMDGISLALKATKEWPSMGLLLMTGYSAERQRAHNLEALTERVIAKPFSLTEFLGAVDAALANRPN